VSEKPPITDQEAIDRGYDLNIVKFFMRDPELLKDLMSGSLMFSIFILTGLATLEHMEIVLNFYKGRGVSRSNNVRAAELMKNYLLGTESVSDTTSDE